MISSNSIRYMSRQAIKDTEEPLTVLELRDFLNRLITGGCGNLNVLRPPTIDTRDELGITGFGVTQYTLSNHNNTLLLE
jgi:hypothetical protein